MNPEPPSSPVGPATRPAVSRGPARPSARVWLPHVVVAACAGFFAWQTRRATGAWPLVPLALATLAGTLLLLAFVAPRVHAPLHRALTTFGRWIAQGFTWLLLALLFAIVFVPGRLVLALFRSDPLGRHPAPAGGTYWKKLPVPAPAATRFPRQF